MRSFLVRMLRCSLRKVSLKLWRFMSKAQIFPTQNLSAMRQINILTKSRLPKERQFSSGKWCCRHKDASRESSQTVTASESKSSRDANTGPPTTHCCQLVSSTAMTPAHTDRQTHRQADWEHFIVRYRNVYNFLQCSEIGKVIEHMKQYQSLQQSLKFFSASYNPKAAAAGATTTTTAFIICKTINRK